MRAQDTAGAPESPARPTTPANARVNLVGQSKAELADTLLRLGEKPFRAKQIWHWEGGYLLGAAK